MGILNTVWRSSVEILKEAATKVGANAARLQVEAARQTLRDGDPSTALDLAESITAVGAVIGPDRTASIDPLIGAAHGVAARAKRALGDFDGAKDSAEQAVVALQRAHDGALKLDGAELSEWGLALVEIDDRSAIDVLQRAVDTGGASQEAYVQLAIVHRSAGDLDQAEGFLRDAIALIPDDPTANGQLGEVLEASHRAEEAAFYFGVAGFEQGRRGNLDVALALLERSRDLNPADPAALIGLAEVHRLKGDLSTALDIAEYSRRLGPDTSTTHFVAGWIMLEMDNPAAAEVAFVQGLELTPDDGYGLAGAARAFAAMGRVNEAASAARRAVESGTDDGVTIALAGKSFEEDHDEDEAIRLYETALEIDPELGFAREGLIGLLLKKADELLDRDCLDEANVVVQRALAADPHDAITHAEQSRIFARAGRWMDALAAADRAVEHAPDMAWGQLQRAEALRGLGRIADAVDAAGIATRLASDNAEAWTFLGDLHVEQGDKAAAVVAYRAALDRDPDHRAALIRLSECFDWLNLDHEAVPFLTDYLERHPDDAEVLRHLGIRLYWSNRDEESLEVLVRALKLDPSQRDARRHVGLVHVALDHWDDAVTWLGPLIVDEGDEVDGYARASLAFAFMALERHSEAAPLSRSVVDSVPQFAFGWQIRARLLNESGWYEHAIDAAREAITLDPETPWPYHSLAWAIGRRGDPREAIDAWGDAERMSPGDLWAIKGRANALAQAGEYEMASDQYRRVLDALDQKARGDPETRMRTSLNSDESETRTGTSLNSDDLALAGWCRLCLAEFADAVKLLVSSVVVDDDPGVQFDLALAMLCAEQTKQAAREYARGIDLLADVDPLRRRGLLEVAIGDLERFRARLVGKAPTVGDSCRATLAAEFAGYEHLHPDNVSLAVDDTTATHDGTSAVGTGESAS